MRKKEKKTLKLLVFFDVLIGIAFSLAVVFFILKKNGSSKIVSAEKNPSISENVTAGDAYSTEGDSLKNHGTATDAEPLFSVATPMDGKMKYAVRSFRETDATVHVTPAEAEQKVLQEELNTKWNAAKTEDERTSLLNEYMAKMPVDENGNQTDGTPIATFYTPQLLTPTDAAAYPAGISEDKLKNQSIASTNMVLVDLDQNTIVAERDYDKVIVPASMTKILSALTAADYLTEKNMNDKYVVSQKDVDFCRKNGLSAVGFLGGEVVTVRDLFYGMLDSSGADAALGLANYVAGSEDDFVKLMNQKAKELGLSDKANFTNPIGLYDKNLHCTMLDMAKIVAAASENPIIRKAMETKYYKTSADKKLVPDGINVTNVFIENIDGVIPGVTEIGAKTGFVNESGFCCASFIKTESGKNYALVTANSSTSHRAVRDQISVYRSYVY